MATETSTLMGTQNCDNVSIAGGTITAVSLNGGTISGATILASPTTLPTGYSGTLVLNGATAVTVSAAAIAITSAIILSLNTVGGSVGVQPHIATITAGQFTVVGTASDTSTMNWAIVKTV